MSQQSWVGPALMLLGVALLGMGIAMMLRVSYIQHPSWSLLILPPAAALLGSALLLFPLLRRLSREAADLEESDRRASDRGGLPHSR